ncbi:hypothetical protein NLJ89_g7012 [Agrocybe chaxingu]|uniref:Uncharacterized protein n=1 Tax=Agrocybe chaxingu TaxID=84603 RepID=A0A9W8MVG4_9AGAR|nr:hypothetical protein NLJ89_g7012 [Agrocybe chaxingu]
MSARDRSNNVFRLQDDDGQLDASTILNIALPWSQLAVLDISKIPMPPGVLLILLHKTTRTLLDGSFQVNFNHCTVETPATSTSLMPLEVPQVAMTRLRRLAVLLVGEGLDEDFFNRIRVPQLRELRAVTMVSRGGSLSFLNPLIASSSRKLVQLELVADTSSQRHIILPTTYLGLEALLEQIPNLHTLRLPHNLYIHTTTLDRLASGSLLPSLQVLEATTSSLENAQDIFSMLARRMGRAANGVDFIREPGPSSASGGAAGSSEVELPSPITCVVLSMPLAEGTSFKQYVLPGYPLVRDGVKIQVEGWS